MKEDEELQFDELEDSHQLRTGRFLAQIIAFIGVEYKVCMGSFVCIVYESPLHIERFAHQLSCFLVLSVGFPNCYAFGL